MYYGRLDVYWPDGPIESHRLEKPTIAVGRSSGNDIALETTAISRYHVTLSFTEHQAVLEDLGSVNGTYVDGVHIQANEPYVLRGGEEIQLGDVRLIYHPPTEDTLVSEETTERVILSQTSYRVQLEGPDMAVAPGAHVQATLEVENNGPQSDRFYVEIDGLPKGWVRVDQPEMDLAPGESRQAVLGFKPLRRSESHPGEYPFTVRVRSKSNPGQTADIPTQLHVLSFSGFGMALDALRPDEEGMFKLYLHNQGNAPLSLGLQGLNREHKFHYQFPQPQVTLGPGEHQTIVGKIQPRRRRLFGDAREHSFEIAVRAQDASGFLATVPGLYTESGMMPSWVPLLALPLFALLVLVGAGGLLLLLAGDDNTPPVQPSILAFTIANPVLALGEDTQVSWQVADADSLLLTIDDGENRQPVTLAPDATSYPLSFGQSGTYHVALEAHNGSEMVLSSAVVEVRPAVALRLEVLGGEKLVRFVEQNIRVSWNVAGARDVEDGYSIWMESPGSVVGLPSAPLSPTGYRDVTVVPQSDSVEWLVTLYAEGKDGVQSSVTQKLEIEAPKCELVAERAAVRGGPGDVYPTLVPPLAGTENDVLTLSPVARSQDSLWLQVPIGQGATAQRGWVLASDVKCTNFAIEKLVPTSDVPQVPSTTPTPSSTQSQPVLSVTVTPRITTPTPNVIVVTATPTTAPLPSPTPGG